MAGWITFGRRGERLGLVAQRADFDSKTVVGMKESSTGLSELCLYKNWAPKCLVNMDGAGHLTWVALYATVRVGDFGGGRVFWGDRAFLRQVDLGPNFAWLVPYLIQLPPMPGPKKWMCGGEALWAWRTAGKRFYLCGEGARWGLYGAGNTPEEHLTELEEKTSWETPQDFFREAGALRLSSRL